MSESISEHRDSAFRAFAEREMPWLLNKPEDDAERLMRTTALIAFGRGYQAGHQSIAAHKSPKERASPYPRATSRAKLEPQLVQLICGLRTYQVKEAINQLLDYIDARDEPTAQSIGEPIRGDAALDGSP